MTLTVIPGQVLPDVPHFGHLAPLGTAIGPNNYGSDIYTQHVPRTWLAKGGGQMDYYLLSQPLYLRGKDELVLPVETAREFRWRLRDAALGAAERSGVSIPPVRDMCREFGAHEPLLRVGGVVSNDVDIATMPDGSIIYLGHPDSPDHLSVWEVSNKRLEWLMGPFPDRPRGAPVTIHSMPGVEQAVDDEPVLTDEAWASIAMRAWRVGKTYKHRQSWCGVFENMLASLGINEESVAKAKGTLCNVGELVNREQAATLPEGSMLWHQWRSNPSKWAVYLRDDSAGNRSKTVRVAGHQDDGANSHDVMTIVSLPDEPYLWQVEGHQMALMPDGVQFRRYGYDESGLLDEESRARLISYHHYSITGWVA